MPSLPKAKHAAAIKQSHISAMAAAAGNVAQAQNILGGVTRSDQPTKQKHAPPAVIVNGKLVKAKSSAAEATSDLGVSMKQESKALGPLAEVDNIIHGIPASSQEKLASEAKKFASEPSGAKDMGWAPVGGNDIKDPHKWAHLNNLKATPDSQVPEN
jgi:hypothetical protein